MTGNHRALPETEARRQCRLSRARHHQGYFAQQRLALAASHVEQVLQGFVTGHRDYLQLVLMQ
jgi:hypothetical protein